MTKDRWETPQPPLPAGDMEPEFCTLLEALARGWEVEEPVYLRTRSGGGRARVYHFILQDTPYGSSRLIAVPEGPEINAFMEAAGLRVVFGR